MTVRSVLKTKGGAVTTLSADALVREAVSLFKSEQIGAAPVISGDAIAGVFSERDLVHGLADIGAAALDRHVVDLMTTPVVTVTPDASAIGALAMMTDRRIRHLPVVENGTLIGIVSIGDLVKHRIELIEAEAASLRRYIQSA